MKPQFELDDWVEFECYGHEKPGWLKKTKGKIVRIITTTEKNDDGVIIQEISYHINCPFGGPLYGNSGYKNVKEEMVSSLTSPPTIEEIMDPKNKVYIHGIPLNLY